MDKLARFKSKAREIHGDRYDYSQVTALRSMDDEVTIVCPEHGPFKQKAKGHIYTKNGCRKCKSSERRESNLEVRVNRFISRSKATHGDRYDYSQVAYESIHKAVTIVCPKHGPFSQTPNNHVNGAGCPKCAKERGPWNKEDLDGFVARAAQRHEDRYDYSQVAYVDAHTKVTIVCPKHGPFSQTPNRHLYGDGCPKCGKLLAVENRRSNVAKKRGHVRLKREEKPKKIKLDRPTTTTKTDEFVQKARKIHEDRYEYSEVVFVNRLSEVTIVCPKHGPFKQKPAYHIAGNGCPKCKFAKLSRERAYTQEEFMRNMERIFGGSLDFSEAVYSNERSAVKVVCPEHGPFHKEPKLLMLGGGCPKCSESNPERIIRGILDRLNLEYTQFDRKTLGGKRELDFVIPSASLAIECHGLYWHSSAVPKSDDWVRNHLRDKWQECNSKGIRLLQFYSDEVEEKRSIIETMISLRAKVYHGPKEYARRLFCKRVKDKAVVKAFLNENHIQGGNTRFDTAYGLFDRERLLSVMCFGRNISVRGSQDPREIELIRFASSGLVVGAASKLLVAFLRDHFDSVDSVFSYSDNRFSDGGVYETLGFELEREVPPSYFYTGRGIGRVHKASMTKKRLSEKFGNLLPEETEEENATKNGLHRIYDAGKKKYRLTLR